MVSLMFVIPISDLATAIELSEINFMSIVQYKYTAVPSDATIMPPWPDFPFLANLTIGIIMEETNHANKEDVKIAKIISFINLILK